MGYQKHTFAEETLKILDFVLHLFLLCLSGHLFPLGHVPSFENSGHSNTCLFTHWRTTSIIVSVLLFTEYLQKEKPFLLMNKSLSQSPDIVLHPLQHWHEDMDTCFWYRVLEGKMNKLASVEKRIIKLLLWMNIIMQKAHNQQKQRGLIPSGVITNPIISYLDHHKIVI